MIPQEVERIVEISVSQKVEEIMEMVGRALTMALSAD